MRKTHRDFLNDEHDIFSTSVVAWFCEEKAGYIDADITFKGCSDSHVCLEFTAGGKKEREAVVRKLGRLKYAVDSFYEALITALEESEGADENDNDSSLC